MKNQKLLAAAAALLLTSALSAKEATVTVVNPLSVARTGAPVTIDAAAIRLLDHSYSGGAVAVYDGGVRLCSQLDDFDGDGKADELAFLLDMKAGESRKIRLVTGDTTAAPCASGRVHAQLFLRDKAGGGITPVRSAASPTGNLYNSLHHHGPAWETGLIAYRAYFDAKQTIDVYGKRRQQLELDVSRWYPTDEQLEQGFGDDVLLVSGSVGVGTLKGWDGVKALHIAPVAGREARIVAAGPLRTVVEMRVQKWAYGLDSLDVTCRYITYAGCRSVEVRVIGGKPFAPDMLLCTGVQKMQKSTEFFSDRAGLACVWGTGFPVNDTVKYGLQTVGLAVAIPANIYGGDATDRVNHLTLIAPGEAKEFTYYFWAVSEKEEWWQVKTAKAFFDFSSNEKLLTLNPPKVNLNTNPTASKR
ncbi:MAG: DUF4861 domain-containing protein [Prevotellaceae bacterium]|jgi:hypothetical protein|nr:DUF4861 domain-containing protein [Prevotellaceae bacterium]